MSRRRTAVAAAVLAGLGVAGCGSAGGSGGSPAHRSPGTSPTSTRPATSTRTRPTLPHVRGPAVGARQAVHTHGADLTVTILSVRTLAGTHTPALPGTREVGVFLRIANQAGETYDSTASGDVSLVLSAGAAEPLDVRAGPCTTPLVDFESMIESGDVRSGCVGFSVPRGTRVLGVRFSPHARSAGTLSWRAG